MQSREQIYLISPYYYQVDMRTDKGHAIWKGSYGSTIRVTKQPCVGSDGLLYIFKSQTQVDKSINVILFLLAHHFELSVL